MKDEEAIANKHERRVSPYIACVYLVGRLVTLVLRLRVEAASCGEGAGVGIGATGSGGDDPSDEDEAFDSGSDPMSTTTGTGTLSFGPKSMMTGTCEPGGISVDGAEDTGLW